MKVREVVPFFAVASLKASLAFYVDGLGFEIEEEWRPEGELRWCMLRLGGGLEPEEPFVGNHMWVTRVVDPDGNRLDFESPTDVPEETRLSELS